MKRPPAKHAGFTLLELLIVIVILIIILSAVFVMLDPLRRYSQTRNTVRRTDSEAIAKAVSFMLTDTDEHLSPALSVLDRKWRMIGTQTSGCTVPCGDLGTSVHALSFTGTGTYVQVPGSSFLNFDYDTPFSFSFWMRPHAVTKYMTFLHKTDAGNAKGYVIGEIEGKVFMALFPTLAPDGIITRDVVLSANQYSHVVITYNGSRLNPAMQIFVNGVAVPVQPTLSPRPTEHFVSTQPLILGGYHQLELVFGLPGFGALHVDGYLQGELDDLRVYNSVLSSSDVLRIKNGGEHQSPSVRLFAHWMFDDGHGTDTEDSSDNDASGELSKDSMWSDTVAPLSTVNMQQGLHYELPAQCVNLQDALVASGQLPKIPVNPATDEVEPDNAMTYYAVRNINGAISVRSCLAEGEGEQGTGTLPSIEVTR